MPEGARAGQQQQTPHKTIVYIGVSDSQEIAVTGQLARYGVPIDVPNQTRIVRHLLDDHGNRYQDVKYPGVADQLLQRPDFIDGGDVDGGKPDDSFEAQPKKYREQIDERAEQVRALELAPDHAAKLALELAPGHGEHVDQVVRGEPGYVIVPAGTPEPGPGGDTAPVEPASTPEPGGYDVQPNPPVNLQPGAPGTGTQTGIAPDADVKEGDADTDAQQQPGRARRRSTSTRATRRG